MKALTSQMKRLRRKARVRVSGTAQRPRLAVFRSLRGMYVQLIDDVARKTIASAHSKVADLKGIDLHERTGKIAIAYGLGHMIAQKAKDAGITTIVFDRGGYAYHGRVEAVAQGARDGGLQF